MALVITGTSCIWLKSLKEPGIFGVSNKRQKPSREAIVYGISQKKIMSHLITSCVW